MKKVDFSKTGGMPVTQNLLDYVQTAYNEQITAMAKSLMQSHAVTLMPVVLYGIAINGITGFVSAGAFYYNGEIILFPGASFPVPSAGQEVAMQITTTSTALMLPYNNGSTPAVKTDKTSTLVLQNTGTAATATQVAYSSFVSPGLVIGQNGREAAFTNLALAGFGGSSGTLSYKKNLVTNTLHIQGSISVVTTTLPADPQPYYAMGTLPAGYRPNTVVPFAAYYRYHQSSLTEDTGLDYLRQINGEILADGTVSVGYLKAAANYTLYFNTIIPLD